MVFAFRNRHVGSFCGDRLFPFLCFLGDYIGPDVFLNWCLGRATERVRSHQVLPVHAFRQFVYVAEYDADLTDMVSGQFLYLQITTTNTGASTLNVNGLGAFSLLKDHDVELVSGDLEAGQIILIVYDGTDYQIQSQSALESGTMFFFDFLGIRQICNGT